jgi:hypothetical protein
MSTPDFAKNRPSQVAVELDIFSGRPNPSWTVRSEQQAALLAKLSDEPETPAGRLGVPPLGYRGFLIRITSQGREDLVHVFDGSIEYDGKHYRDADRAVERFIIDTMPDDVKRGFNEVVPNLPP